MVMIYQRSIQPMHPSKAKPAAMTKIQTEVTTVPRDKVTQDAVEEMNRVQGSFPQIQLKEAKHSLNIVQRIRKEHRVYPHAYVYPMSDYPTVSSPQPPKPMCTLCPTAPLHRL